LHAEEDEKSLRKALEDASARVLGDGGLLRVTLQDAFGMPVSCQVSHTTFKQFDGSVHHLLGINEIGERDIRDNKGETEPMDMFLQNSPSILMNANSGRDPDKLSPESSVSGASSASCDSDGQLGGQIVLQAWNGEIVKCSANLSRLLGDDAVNSAITDFIDDTASLEAFDQWLEEMFFLVTLGKELPATLQLTTPIIIKASTCRFYRVQFEATFLDFEEACMEPDNFLINLTVTSSRRIKAPANTKKQKKYQGRGESRSSQRRELEERSSASGELPQHCLEAMKPKRKKRPPVAL